MTTQELINTSDRTCYYGPGHDRLTLKEAQERGILRFQVRVSHIHCGVGEPEIKGSYLELEPAIEKAKGIKHAEVHAIAAPFNFPECLIWAEWWNPLNL